MDTLTLTGRRTGVDALRGLAVALMVLDHLLIQTGDATSPLRYTLTRLSLPLFVGCAAVVYRGRLRPGRAWVLAGCVAAELLLNAGLHLGSPGPVTLIAGTMLLFSTRAAQRHAPVLAALGLLQALYVPVGAYLPVVWGGYQPGLIVAWWVLAAAAVDTVEHRAERLPAVLAAIGRRPALWYVGHLCALTILTQAAVL